MGLWLLLNGVCKTDMSVVVVATVRRVSTKVPHLRCEQWGCWAFSLFICGSACEYFGVQQPSMSKSTTVSVLADTDAHMYVAEAAVIAKLMGAHITLVKVRVALAGTSAS